jgi:Ca2+/Na+ antiporter
MYMFPFCFFLHILPCPATIHSLSFVTEQVAEHTNGTIGALLNATFGNAPELLIATAALRSGFYRVVQLAMLGSMLTNLLLVFGMSCLVGGIRWQVQEIRITSGNVSVGMLLLSVTGSLLPAALILSGQLKHDDTEEGDEQQPPQQEDGAHIPTLEELQFSRVNAIIMIFMYGCYLIFQLGTHKEEFDDDENVVESADGHALHLTPHFTSRHGRQHKAHRNTFCLNWIQRLSTRRQRYSLAPGFLLGRGGSGGIGTGIGSSGVELSVRPHDSANNLFTYQDEEEEEAEDEVDMVNGNVDGHAVVAAAAAAGRVGIKDDGGNDSDEDSGKLLPQNRTSRASSEENGYFDEYIDEMPVSVGRTTRTPEKGGKKKEPSSPYHEPGRLVPLGLTDPTETAIMGKSCRESLPNDKNKTETMSH